MPIFVEVAFSLRVHPLFSPEPCIMNGVARHWDTVDVGIELFFCVSNENLPIPVSVCSSALSGLLIAIRAIEVIGRFRRDFVSYDTPVCAVPLNFQFPSRFSFPFSCGVETSWTIRRVIWLSSVRFFFFFSSYDFTALAAHA